MTLMALIAINPHHMTFWAIPHFNVSMKDQNPWHFKPLAVSTDRLNQKWVPVERCYKIFISKGQNEVVIDSRSVRKLHFPKIFINSLFELFSQLFQFRIFVDF